MKRLVAMTNAQTTQRIDCKMSKRLDTKLNRCTSVQVEHQPSSNAHTYCESDLTRATATKRISMAFGTSIPWNASLGAPDCLASMRSRPSSEATACDHISRTCATLKKKAVKFVPRLSEQSEHLATIFLHEPAQTSRR